MMSQTFILFTFAILSCCVPALLAANAVCVGSERLSPLPGIEFDGAAPREMPAEYRDAYTCGGRIEEHEFYIDETNGGKGKLCRCSFYRKQSRKFAKMQAPISNTPGKIQSSFWLV